MRAFFASKPLLTLLLAAFLLRAGAALVVQTLLDHHWQREFVIAGDAQGYWRLAQAIIAGEPYAVYDPPRHVLRMPGFPALLALPMWISGGSFVVVRLFLAAIGAGACGLVFLLGRELFDDVVALWAGWFTALSPGLVGFSTLILSETAFALGVVGSVWGLAKLLHSLPMENPLRRPLCWGLVTGGFIALATYVRPSWLPAVLLFAVGTLLVGRCRPRSIAASVVMAGTVAVALFPWAWRNHQVTGHWVITTLWSGPSLYDGLNPEATGESNMEFFDRDNLLQKMSEYEVNQRYWQAAIRYAQDNPGRALELAFAKCRRYWKLWPSVQAANHWAIKLVWGGFSLILFACSLLGFWFYRRRIVALALTAGPVLFFALLHSVFVGSMRYRLPAEYPLAVLAAAGGIECWRRCSARWFRAGGSS